MSEKSLSTPSNIFLDTVGDRFKQRMTELKVLGVVLSTKLSFESHIRYAAASAFSKLQIMRIALSLFGEPVLVSRGLEASCLQC